MASPPLFRFVQASNLELDRFCSASGDLNSDQGRLLVDAPFRAAERMFETALEANAELILLVGGTFVGRHPSTWGASFLARHCERAGRRGIQVCWLDCGEERSRGWPRFLPLPDNLHICNADTAGPIRLKLPSAVVVEIHAADDPVALQKRIRSQMSGDAPPFRIGALTQAPRGQTSLDRPIEYWAISDGDGTTTYPTAHGMARCSGTVQPRHCSTVAAGGCLLIDVGPGYSLGSRFVETNSLRYHVERVVTDDSTNWEGFRRRLHARTDEVLQATVADAVMFHWQVHGHGPVIERLVSPNETRGLEQELRSAFGACTPAAWLAHVVPSADAVQETRWQRAGSPFGAFVRSLDTLPSGDGPDVDLTRLAPGHIRTIDPAATHIPRPHYETSLKSNARRHAAQALSHLNR